MSICGQLPIKRNMADNGKDKREDEITVVKDESDEVIRLDAPEPKPIEKIEKKGWKRTKRKPRKTFICFEPIPAPSA